MTINDLASESPLALLIEGPHHGLLVPVTGPYEVHMQEDSEYLVVPRGNDTWKFPIHYRFNVQR